MKRTYRTDWGAGCLLLLATAASAETPTAIDYATAAAYRPPVVHARDPFTPSQAMYEAIGASSGAAGAFGFVPSPESADVPKMKLRGLLSKHPGDFIALLEITGVGTFMVREGDEFNIDPSRPKSAIRISKITRLSITVETGWLGSIRVLR
ncbi:MAG: hypothetical protein KGZ80_11375 [Methylomonas sp.]|nr:hypothetical protein [Methylomonas sp.]PPD21146.1 MAG: hypothetical protein CTY23_06565 [Methylomonas sp.]PPD27580.1 MAG: hypothetical protein CTY22_01595 [Methylomonas sp.]PPD39576.1 MAG: hypothetical protein CTY21_01590 [Methylomonas sp.]PPD55827.1 MAG: hypothetical protein CTY11_00860 [Methylomonas sp.]